MSKIELAYLLERYKAGTITPEERILLENWYLEWQPDQVEVSADELETIKLDVWRAIKRSEGRKFKLFLIGASVAASLVMIVFFVTYFSPKKITYIKQDDRVQVVQDFQPGGNKAILTLGNGTQIALKEAGNGSLANQGAIQVNKTADGKIVYETTGTTNQSAVNLIYNTITTPRGGQYQVVLSDGTVVWLNAASSITYPVVFKGKERNVKITGEVYFEVAHNKKMKFKVTSGNQEITVFGTRFNISSYADDAESSTALLSGSIQVKNLQSGSSRMLLPGQGSRILNTSGEITVNRVDIEQVIAWRNGYFIFDNQGIKNIMKILSRWYNVEVAYQDENINERFGGTFSRAKNLSETLKNIEQLSDIRFKMSEGKVTVSN